MSKTKCSIITVSYNSEKTIRRTIESVLNQTYENIEYIIIDGGSTDGTVDIIKDYEKAFDGRMKWTSEPDDGIYYAMNKGLDIATGELIGIINSDDWYENDAVEIVIKKYTDKNDKYVVFHGETYAYLNEKLNFIAKLIPANLENEMGSHPSCFVTKETYCEFGKFNTRYSCVADHDFMLRLYRNNVIFTSIDCHIANAELGGISSSTKAYIDSLKFKFDNNKISKIEMYCEIYKAKLADFLIEHGFKPVTLRKSK